MFEFLGAKHTTELQADERGEMTMVHANQWSAKLCVRASFLRATSEGILRTSASAHRLALEPDPVI